MPVVLNTSFNDNEPIVCQPSEAVDCFVRTEMDVLVLGNPSSTGGPAGDQGARERSGSPDHGGALVAKGVDRSRSC